MIGQAALRLCLPPPCFPRCPACLSLVRLACLNLECCLPLLRQRHHCFFPAAFFYRDFSLTAASLPLSAKIRPALDDDRSSSLEFASALIFLRFFCSKEAREGRENVKRFFIVRSFYGESMFVVAGASLLKSTWGFP